MTDIAELRALVAKATPGPWRVWDTYPSHICVDHTKCGTVSVCQISLNTYHDESRHNRDLIVAAVNALPALLDRLEAAERDAERWRKCITDGEFPKRHKGEWLHVCRTTGDILVMPTAAEVIDAAIDAARGKP